jgi:hypothetical protein
MRVKDDKNVFLDPLLRWLRIRKVKKYIPYGARLLDLGCGFEAMSTLIQNPCQRTLIASL